MPPRFVVIGAGMAGILAAVKLRDAGYNDVAVYEKAAAPGGTWRDNTYPGVACDVPSHMYSYSFAPNPDWSHVFSPGPEIQAYLVDVARRHGVLDQIRLGEEVVLLKHTGTRWRLRTKAGSKDDADFVIAATGVLHHPAYPDIDGLDDFEGPVFHSARWDHSITPESARLGVIGTGSSGVQIVSAVAAVVRSLHVFQRTAQWILPVPNPPIDEDDKSRYRADPEAIRIIKQELTESFELNFANAVIDADSPQMHLLELRCREYLEKSVEDPELREMLLPPYRAACKRLVVSPTFYGAIQHPNVRLVTDPIERIEPPGIRTRAGLHQLDVIVLATGFRVDRFLRPMTVVGRDGVPLDRVWADRPSAYLSISVPGFPNLFMINGPNGPVGNFSLIDVAEMQMAYILQLVRKASDGGDPPLQVSAGAAATERFEAARVEATRNTVWVTGCRSWYLDDRGVPAVWPWRFDRFREEMARPRFDDFEFVG